MADTTAQKPASETPVATSKKEKTKEEIDAEEEKRYNAWLEKMRAKEEEMRRREASGQYVPAHWR